jgi:hypothetical protein
MTNGKQKGKRGELELCRVLKELFGWDARRSVQFNGNAGDADLIVPEAPGLFVECKRVQALNLGKAMKLAIQQAGPKLPAIFHRRNNEEWMVTVRCSDLKGLCQMIAGDLSATPPEPSDPTSPAGTTSSPSKGCTESQQRWPTGPKGLVEITG